MRAFGLRRFNVNFRLGELSSHKGRRGVASLGSEFALTVGAQGRAGDMVRQACAGLEAAWDAWCE